MNKSLVGSLAIIFGSLVLALELFGLKIIQALDMQKGSWHTSPMDYASEFPIAFALCITIAVIIYGIILMIGADKLRKLFKY